MDRSSTRGPFSKWPPLLVLAVGAYFVATAVDPLKSRRPPVDAVSTEDLSLYKSFQAPARLWEDPLLAVEPAWKKTNNDTAAVEAGRQEITALLMKHGVGSKVLVLPVLLDVERYAERGESRLRTRYAILTALSRFNFHPSDTETIRFFEAGASLGSLVGHGKRFPVPYEWCEPLSVEKGKEGGEGKEKNEASVSSPYKRVLILWLGEQFLGEAPLSAIHSILSAIDPQGIAYGAPRPVHILGPTSSTLLGDMLKEADDRALFGATDLALWRIYSDRATLPSFLLENSGERQSDKTGKDRYKRKSGLWWRRTLSPDDKVVRRLIDELALRDADPRKEGNHLLIFSEWDTVYGRAWSKTFGRVIRDKRCGSGGVAADADQLPSNFHFYSYLRGIDGKLPRDSVDAFKKSEAGQENKTPNQPRESAIGRNQLDYIRRVEQELLGLSGKNKLNRREVKAVGVLGSDVYDKLLLLRALRRAFPAAIFFTTDLDARFLHPEERKWTRNLVIASAYGLWPTRLEEGLTPIGKGSAGSQEIPPFRDSYQTSSYAATQWALCETVEKADPRGFRLIESGIYEIGRDRAFELGYFTVDETGSTITNDPLHAPMDLSLTLNVCLLVLLLAAFASPLFRSLLLSRDQNIGPQHPGRLADLFGWNNVGARLPEKEGRYPVPIMLAVPLAWVVLLLGIAYVDSHSPNGEPFSFFESVSIWPTELFRLLGVCAAMVVFLWAYAGVSTSSIQIGNRYFGMKRTAPWLEGFLPVWLWVVGLLGAAVIVAIRMPWMYPLFAFLVLIGVGTVFLRSKDNRLKHSISGWVQKEPVSAIDLWKDYGALGRSGAVSIRILTLLPLFIASLGLLFALGDPPGNPTRGTLSWGTDKAVLIVSVGTFLTLLAYTMDANRLCRQWIENMREKKIDWPESFLEREYAGIHASMEAKSEAAKIDLIAKRTAAIDRLMYAPFVLLFALLVARNPVFENWGWNLALVLTFLTTGSGSVMGAIWVRQSAAKVRRAALQSLGERKLRATGELKSKGKKSSSEVKTEGASGISVSPDADREEEGGTWEDLEKLIEHVTQVRDGAFRKLHEHVLVRAVILPLTGFGAMELAGLWYTFM